MTAADASTRLVQLLEDLRAGQQLQLERQAEVLELQRRQFEVFQEQAARTERSQHKAEVLQDRGASLVGGARKTLMIILPVIVLMLGYLTWLLFRSGFF